MDERGVDGPGCAVRTDVRRLTAVGAAGYAWDEAGFVEYVQDPGAFLKAKLGDTGAKTKMSFKLKGAEKAADVYASLAQFSPAPAADAAATNTDTPAGLPYTATYSSNWSTNVSDADLKTVLQSYKDWADGNMKGLGAAMADTVDIDLSSGKSMHMTNDSLMTMWGKSRDSLSSVVITMDAWHKMYSVDKKDEVVVTWYKEVDTYKSGKADSAYFHDINMLKKGKIVWYSQYKRPILPK